MSDDLKERVLEIVSIAKECPENLQPLCFELLLRDYLEGGSGCQPRLRLRPRRRPGAASGPGLRRGGQTSTGQQDLKAGDLHVKVRKFMERHAVPLDHLNSCSTRTAARLSRSTRT